MQMREWPVLTLACVLFIGAALLPTAAIGQVILGQLTPRVEKTAEQPAEGFYVTPSLSVGEIYDDNLFFSSTQREKDFFTRVSPVLQAGYQSTPLTLLGGYTFDSEFYSKHSELTTAQVRQRGVIELKAMPDQVLTLSVSGAYYQTRTPQELNLTTGLATSRVLAERYTGSPAFTYRFDPLTTSKGDYTYAKDLVAGGITIDSHIVNLVLDHRITPRDTMGPMYTGRQFRFAGFPTITSHAFTLGWSHEFTPLTTFTLRGGPRLTEGKVDRLPEAFASISHKLKSGALSLSYGSTSTTTIGQATAVRTQSITGTATTELLPKLELSAGPAVYWISSDAFKATAYWTLLQASYQLTKTLALQASYQYSFQRGSFNPQTGPTGPTNVEILHNIFLIRLTVTSPVRMD